MPTISVDHAVLFLAWTRVNSSTRFGMASAHEWREERELNKCQNTATPWAVEPDSQKFLILVPMGVRNESGAVFHSGAWV